MRRNILIIISFLTLLVSSGCTNLDEKWYSEVTPDTYFTSKETVYSFLVRSFTHWRWFHGFDRAILQECTTDEMCVTQKGIHYNDVRYSQLEELYKNRGLESRLLSRTVEDSVTVTSVLIPWNSCGMTQATVLGVSTLTYLPYCFFNLLSPLMSIIIAFTGFKIKQTFSSELSGNNSKPIKQAA